MSKETRNVGLAFLFSILIVSTVSMLSYLFVLQPKVTALLVCAL